MKLLIADDHTLFRDALVQYIERAEPDASVSLAKDFYQAIDILEENPHHDLVVLDLRMPGMNGMNGFETMKERFPDIRVALMSGIAEDNDVKRALDLGAVGYFPKTLSGKALLSGIQSVIQGSVFVPEGKKSSFMPAYYADLPEKKSGQGSVDLPEDVNLTNREREVLSFLADGVSNKEIASALNLQIVTVKLHVRGVCRKLGVSNRTQAALMAREMGIKPRSQAH